jgi:cell wall-associated NlpC family hydrolase
VNQTAAEVDQLAALLEQLMTDQNMRTLFRRDPEAVCRASGLNDLAEQLSGSGKAMHTLELRESKSSLAGMLVAAAAEGVGLAELVHYVYEHMSGASAHVAAQALTRAGMPVVHQTMTAAGLPVVPAPGAAPAGIPAGIEPSAGVPGAVPAAMEPPAGAPGAIPAAVEPAGAAPGQLPASMEPSSLGAAPGAAADAALASPAPAQPLGVDASAILDNPRIGFSQTARAGMAGGTADPRLVATLTQLSEHHRIEVSAVHDDGSVDISAVDGRPVSSHNASARIVAEQLASLDERIRPSGVASPWPMSGGAFTSGDVSADKIRLEFAGAPPPGAGGTAVVPAVPGAAAPPVAGAAFPVDSLTEPAPNPVAESAVTAAKRMIGTPYVWGAETPRVGFDCSGLVQWAYHQAGHPIDRTTWEQIKQGTPVHWGQFKPGDLIFSNFEGGSDPTHVVMYIGHGKVVAAPHTGADVQIQPVSWFKDYYVGARRIAPLEQSGGASQDVVDGAVPAAPAVAGTPAVAEMPAASPSNTVQFMPAVHDPNAVPVGHAAEAHADLTGAPDAYPGDNADQTLIAAWMARKAQEAGLPPELPVMAALTESHLRNLDYGDASSVGYFQMLSDWNHWDGGKYSGFANKPELQMQWFIDHAVAYKDRYQGKHGAYWMGQWAADVERPRQDLRGRYAEHYNEALHMLRSGGPHNASGMS